MIDCLPLAFALAIHEHAPDVPLRTAAAQVRAESACNPQAMRRVAGEQGCGWAQFTRAWRANGAIRFDTLSELRAKYPKILGGWTWERCDDVRFQFPAYALLMRDYGRAVGVWRDALTHVIATAAAYNQGVGGVQRDQRLCATRAGCDPAQWFGHVETACGASRAVIAGTSGRSACEVNRNYVRKVARDAPQFAAKEAEIVKRIFIESEKRAEPVERGRDHEQSAHGGARALAFWERIALRFVDWWEARA